MWGVKNAATLNQGTKEKWNTTTFVPRHKTKEQNNFCSLV